MKDLKWYEGGCFCGGVRYRVRGNAVWKAGCTCSSCVKMHSAPVVAWAGFNQSDFEITRGDPTKFCSSKHVVRSFCPVCGSTLTYGKHAKGVAELKAAASLVYIAVASLDDPELYPPDEIVHGQEMFSWMQFSEDIPVRPFVSEAAGQLQFGGIDPDLAAELAERHFSSNERKKK